MKLARNQILALSMVCLVVTGRGLQADAFYTRSEFARLSIQDEARAVTIRVLEDKIRNLQQKVADANAETADLKARDAAQITMLSEKLKYLQGRLDQSAQEKIATRKAAEENERRADETLVKLQHEREDLRKQNDDLKTELSTNKKQLTELQDQAQSLRTKLQTEIAQGGLRIRQMNDRLIINMDNQILFDTGSAALKPTIFPALQKIGDVLAEHPGEEIRVQGNTDNVPIHNWQFRDNWQLSAERALAVLGRLLANPKLDPHQFLAVGSGEFRPVKPNDSEDNRALNRRVDIEIRTSSGTEKPAAQGRS